MKIPIITPTIEAITTKATKEGVINFKIYLLKIIKFKDSPEEAEKLNFQFFLFNLFLLKFFYISLNSLNSIWFISASATTIS